MKKLQLISLTVQNLIFLFLKFIIKKLCFCLPDTNGSSAKVIHQLRIFTLRVHYLYMYIVMIPKLNSCP